MNSNRLPNKALTNISGIPLLQRVINKISFSDRVSSIVVATSDKKSDDPIALFCKKIKLNTLEEILIMSLIGLKNY